MWVSAGSSCSGRLHNEPGCCWDQQGGHRNPGSRSSGGPASQGRMPSHPAMAPPTTWHWQRSQLASVPFCPQQGQSCLIHAPTHPLPTGPPSTGPAPSCPGLQPLSTPALPASTCPLYAPLLQGRQGLCEMQTWLCYSLAQTLPSRLCLQTTSRRLGAVHWALQALQNQAWLRLLAPGCAAHLTLSSAQGPLCTRPSHLNTLPLRAVWQLPRSLPQNQPPHLGSMAPNH